MGTPNFANVSHSDYEFTVTFARVDHEVEAPEIPGVVVSRVNLSARFMRELIDAMEDNYSKWRARESIKNLPEYGSAPPPGEYGDSGADASFAASPRPFVEGVLALTASGRAVSANAPRQTQFA